MLGGTESVLTEIPVSSEDCMELVLLEIPVSSKDCMELVLLEIRGYYSPPLVVPVGYKTVVPLHFDLDTMSDVFRDCSGVHSDRTLPLVALVACKTA